MGCRQPLKTLTFVAASFVCRGCKSGSLVARAPRIIPFENTICQTNTKGRFTLWPKVERLSISTNQIARNQEFGFSILHNKAKVQRSS
jgi:hypothetical protein